MTLYKHNIARSSPLFGRLLYPILLSTLVMLTGCAGVQLAEPTPLPPGPTATPDPYAGWKQLDNGVFKLRYPADWWIRYKDEQHVAVQNESNMLVRIELHSELLSMNSLIEEAEADAGFADTFRSLISQHYATGLDSVGIRNPELVEIERAEFAERPVFLNLAYEAVGELTVNEVSGQFHVVIIPAVACTESEVCAVFFTGPVNGRITPDVWEMAAKIVRTVEITR